ncbi:hypothetical protein PENTCL1PPCAC_8806, partial [Pristionchus entomophagus]
PLCVSRHRLEMALRTYVTNEDLRVLCAMELEGDTYQDEPITSFIDSTIQIAISRVFTLTQLDVFGFPAIGQQYIYCMETSDVQHPYLHVKAPPASDVDWRVLHDGARLLLEKYRQQILEHGRIMISTDEHTSDAFEALITIVFKGKMKRIMNSNCGMFYMTNDQRENLLAMEIPVPAGFRIESVNADKDGDTIYSLWKNAISREVTIERLRCFPSICVRDSAGELVGWAMTGRFGQISNEFVMPEHRGKGLGRAVELALAKELIRKGRRVFKYVDIANEAVYESSSRSTKWTLWREEDGKRKPLYFRKFEIVS